MTGFGHDVSVTRINDVHCRVQCAELAVGMDLVDGFTFEVPGAKFTPAFKNKVWDGKVRLYSPYQQTLYVGLLPALREFCNDRELTISVDPLLENSAEAYSTEEISNFLNNLNLSAHGTKITPLAHQIEGVRHCLNARRSLLLSPTASGKSMIVYGVVRMLKTRENARKTLIVVPTISLVNQLFSDFEDYSSTNKWNVEENVHKIMGGEEKTSHKPIFISTWQSLFRLPKDYFEQFDSVIIDEAHTAKAESLKGILEKMVDCPFRLGLTGTLDGMKTNKLVIEGLLGAVHRIATTRELIDKDILSKFKIRCINLRYPDEDRKACKKLKYPEEIDWLVSSSKRNHFLCNLALNLKGNTLILYRYVDKHGKVLKNLVESLNKDSTRKVFFVCGETDADTREEIRKLTEKEENAILICSEGTFSVGVNIRKLHNIIFASPNKARIRVLQSIGRQLRKSENKEIATLYDISDDLSWKSHNNYSLKHSVERITIYNEEHFDYSIANVRI